MKKKLLVDLIRAHINKDNYTFNLTCSDIANDFYNSGDVEVAQYIQGLIGTADLYTQDFIKIDYNKFTFLKSINLNNVKHTYLPTSVANDIQGIINCLKKGFKLNKFLFYGRPGSGKTETVKNIALMLDKEVLKVNLESLIDSKLGQTSKNIIFLFDEIDSIKYPERFIILFDEIDALILNRNSNNDLREMARATSTFFSQLDEVKPDITIIATTNLFKELDKALIRRFDGTINFDRYTKEDLVLIGQSICDSFIKNRPEYAKDGKLLKKILNCFSEIPYPGDLQNIIKTSIAFSNSNDPYDYLKRLLEISFKPNYSASELLEKGFTTREIEVLTGISKSSVSRLSVNNKENYEKEV